MVGSICCAVLMCHAPIVVPEVGGEEGRLRVSATMDAMHKASRCVVRHRPDAVIVLSPHAPRHRSAWTIADDPVLAGHFGCFRAAQVTVEMPSPPRTAGCIEAHARKLALSTVRYPLGRADHGALVPLYFLGRAGWRGPTLRIAFPHAPNPDECEIMGRVLAQAAAAANQRWAIVASGNMSHRLQVGSPAGHHPCARSFDDTVTRAMRAGQYRRIADMDPAMRNLAAEDAIDSLSVAAAATGWRARQHRVLSYQGAFGVGYLVAILHEERDGGPSFQPPRAAA